MVESCLVAKKVALILTIVGLFAAVPTWATQIDFAGIGQGGTWSWSGSGPLTATAQGVDLKLVGSPSSFMITGTESFSTGSFMGGSGTLASPSIFGPSGANSFTIMGCIPPATSCSSPSALFTGQFTGDQGVLKGTGSLLFDAPDVMGTVNAGVLSFLGLSGTSSSVTGALNFALTGSTPGGLTGSGDLIVGSGSTVPEPVSMALLGTGLLVLGLCLRLKGFGVKG